MAAAESVSDLRVVLLGGSWTQRNFVGKFILGNDVFSKIPETFFRVSEPVGEQKVTVINTPDLQFSTQESLTGFVKDCAKASDPGPHVFVLVVHPEDLNERDKDMIFKVLDHFNDQSFHYSFLLIMTRKQDNSPLKEKYTDNPLLIDLIEKCKFRALKEEDMDHTLLSRFSQIVKENDGQYVSYEAFEETPSNQRENDQNQRQKTTFGLVSTVTDAGDTPLQSIEASTGETKAPDTQRDSKSRGAQEGPTQEIRPPTKGGGDTALRKTPATTILEPPGAVGRSLLAPPAASHPEVDPAMGPRDPRPQGHGGLGPVDQPPGLSQYPPGHPPPNIEHHQCTSELKH
ncbi:GTPase IMAP family member 6-like [Cyprinodon tularosa]|uniref:GTPase IMAP family member 6-like n=1 Tax=Cyprinodon tularosa TaxID=77115 RepID=UPI0018E2645A|nr:GTPase IMAP family member 6-like [Cyprinodon tularosa]